MTVLRILQAVLEQSWLQLMEGAIIVSFKDSLGFVESICWFEVSDQTVWICGLITVFTGRICYNRFPRDAA